MYLNRSRVGERNRLDSKQICTSRQPGWTGRPPAMKQRTVMEGSKVPLEAFGLLGKFLPTLKSLSKQKLATHLFSTVCALGVEIPRTKEKKCPENNRNVPKGKIASLRSRRRKLHSPPHTWQ